MAPLSETQIRRATRRLAAYFDTLEQLAPGFWVEPILAQAGSPIWQLDLGNDIPEFSPTKLAWMNPQTHRWLVMAPGGDTYHGCTAHFPDCFTGRIQGIYRSTLTPSSWVAHTDANRTRHEWVPARALRKGDFPRSGDPDFGILAHDDHLYSFWRVEDRILVTEIANVASRSASPPSGENVTPEQSSRLVGAFASLIEAGHRALAKRRLPSTARQTLLRENKSFWYAWLPPEMRWDGTIDLLWANGERIEQLGFSRLPRAIGYGWELERVIEQPANRTTALELTIQSAHHRGRTKALDPEMLTPTRFLRTQPPQRMLPLNRNEQYVGALLSSDGCYAAWLGPDAQLLWERCAALDETTDPTFTTTDRIRTLVAPPGILIKFDALYRRQLAAEITL